MQYRKMAETHHLVYPPGVADLFHVSELIIAVD